MVSVTRTGLRLASSAADTPAVAGAAAGLENEFISSIQVGLVTGREFVPRRPTKTLQHINGAGKRVAAHLLQLARGPRTRAPSPPSSCCSAIARPLGTGLKIRHTFLRALAQVLGLDVPPWGGVDLELVAIAQQQRNGSRRDPAFLSQKPFPPQIPGPNRPSSKQRQLINPLDKRRA